MLFFLSKTLMCRFSKATYFSPRVWFKWLTGLICWRKKKDIGGLHYINLLLRRSRSVYTWCYWLIWLDNNRDKPFVVWWLPLEEILVDSVTPYLDWMYDLLSACILLVSSGKWCMWTLPDFQYLSLSAKGTQTYRLVYSSKYSNINLIVLTPNWNTINWLTANEMPFTAAATSLISLAHPNISLTSAVSPSSSFSLILFTCCRRRSQYNLSSDIFVFSASVFSWSSAIVTANVPTNSADGDNILEWSTSYGSTTGLYLFLSLFGYL